MSRRAFDEALTGDPSYQEIYSSAACTIFRTDRDIDLLFAELAVTLDAKRDAFLLHCVGRREAKAFGLPLDDELFEVLDYLTSGRGH